MSEGRELRTADYLDPMLDAMSRVETYVAGVADASAFAQQQIVHDAVVRNLEIIGEAARNVRRFDADFVARHDSAPWAAVCGMRNRITHGYFDINLTVVWQTVRNDLPDLRDKIAVARSSLS